MQKNTFPSCLYPVLLELDPYTENYKMNERNQLAIFIFYCLITKNMQQLAGCIIYMLHFQNATAELKRKWD